EEERRREREEREGRRQHAPRAPAALEEARQERERPEERGGGEEVPRERRLEPRGPDDGADQERVEREEGVVRALRGPGRRRHVPGLRDAEVPAGIPAGQRRDAPRDVVRPA